jgi:hypothetical protein
LTYSTNGYYQADNFLLGSSAIYADYTLKGNAVIYCNGSGFWNGSTPVCVPNPGGSGAAGGEIGNVQKTVLVVVFIERLLLCFK